MSDATLSRLSELERLMEKESYRIVILNGHPPRFGDLLPRLREDGYATEEGDGPSIAQFLPPDDHLENPSPDEQKQLEQAISIALQATDAILETRPQCLFINYANSPEGQFLFGTVKATLVTKRIPLRALTLLNADYYSLVRHVDIGRALKFFYHRLSESRQEFLEKRVDPTNRIRSKLMVIQGYLEGPFASNVEAAEQHLGQFQPKLREAYEEIERMRQTATGDRAFLLTEWAYKISGVHSLFYRSDIAQSR